MSNKLVTLILLFIPSSSFATRAIMEQTPASANTIFVDTQAVQVVIGSSLPTAGMALSVNGAISATSSMTASVINGDTGTFTNQVGAPLGAFSGQVLISTNTDFADTYGPHSLTVAGPEGKNILTVETQDGAVQAAMYLKATATDPFQWGTITDSSIGFFTNNGSPQFSLNPNGGASIGTESTPPANGLLISGPLNASSGTFSGNVGINTSAPSQSSLLDVESTNGQGDFIVYPNSLVGPLLQLQYGKIGNLYIPNSGANIINLQSEFSSGNSSSSVSGLSIDTDLRDGYAGTATGGYFLATSSAPNIQSGSLGGATGLTSQAKSFNGGDVFGENPYAGCYDSSCRQTIGEEIDTDNQYQSAAKAGIQIVDVSDSSGSVTSSDYNNGILFVNGTGAYGFDQGIQFSTGSNAQFPVRSDGTLIKSENGNVANGIDFSNNMSFANAAFLSGSGNIGVGISSPSVRGSLSSVFNQVASFGSQISCGIGTGQGLNQDCDIEGPFAEFSANNWSGFGLLGFNMIVISTSSEDSYVTPHSESGASGVQVYSDGVSILGDNSSTSAGGDISPSVIAKFKTDGNVGIGTTSPAAPLDVASTTSGIGIPVLTTTQVESSTPGRVGIIVFNSTKGEVCVSTGTAIGAYEVVGNTLLTACQ